MKAVPFYIFIAGTVTMRLYLEDLPGPWSSMPQVAQPTFGWQASLSSSSVATLSSGLDSRLCIFLSKGLRRHPTSRPRFRRFIITLLGEPIDHRRLFFSARPLPLNADPASTEHPFCALLLAGPRLRRRCATHRQRMGHDTIALQRSDS